MWKLLYPTIVSSGITIIWYKKHSLANSALARTMLPFPEEGKM
jgi:hypothetical protein